MKDEFVLFIGGNLDGRRLKVPEHDHRVMTHMPAGGSQCYERAFLAGESGAEFCVMVLEGTSGSKMLESLIDGYAAK